MTVLNAFATAPDVRSAIRVVTKYLEMHSGDLFPVQKEAAGELRRQIKRLENECNRLIAVNNLLLDRDGATLTFDQGTAIGMLPDDVFESLIHVSISNDDATISTFKTYAVIIGVVYATPGVILLWANRRRYPKKLAVADKEWTGN